MKVTEKKTKNRLLNVGKYFLVLFLIVLPLIVKNPFYQDLLFMMFFYSVLAGAWNFIGGFAGQTSLGHTAFFGIGAYTSTLLYLNLGISPWIGMLAGAALAMLVSIAIAVPCFRLKSHFFALSTIAFAAVLRYLATYFRGITKGAVGLLIPFNNGWPTFMFRNKIPYIYLTLTLMLIVVFVSYLIKISKTGYYLRALRENQDAAESLGVNTSLYKLIALLISVFFVALAGTFYAQYLLYIDPETVFSFSISISMALFSIIGGIGTVTGPILGAFILTPLDVMLRAWFGNQYFGINYIIYGIVLVVVVIYLPSGIISWIEKKYNLIIEKLLGGKLFSEKVVKELVFNQNEVMLPKLKLEEDINKRPILFEVKELTKRFGGLVAVNNVDFKIKQGDILGLIGPNGAGKTTIFNLVSGFLVPDSGKVLFKGKDITNIKPPHKICATKIGRTFQVVKPFQKMTVLENVMVGTFAVIMDRKRAEKKARQLVNFFGLNKCIDYLAENLTIADRKKLELCRVLATEPELLLLDEVMSGLNPKETEEIINLVRKISEQGITLLVIEHIMQVIMTLSNHIVVLNYGKKIAEGIPKEISKNRKVIDAYLGEEYVIN